MSFTVIAFIILILSIIVHEVAHGYAANALGDPTARLAGRLTLNPIPHIDIVGSILVPILLLISHSPIFFGWAKPVPYNPYNLKNHRYGEAMVAGAGVATNLFIAIIFGLLARFGMGFLSPNAITVAELIAFINLFLGLFNLIPFPPLDGFTVLRGLLPFHSARALVQIEARLRSQGTVFILIVFLLVFSYVLSGPFFSLVSKLFTLITGTPFG